MNAVPTFSDRLARRRGLWWGRPRLTGGREVGDAIHRLRERRAFRSRDDPPHQWRCCAYWPRTLLNKWNGREFAARHGARLPTLYWHGSDPDDAPLESLPNRFVVRPVFGAARRGALVVVDGEERLWGGDVTAEEIRRRLRRARFKRSPVLIEEFVEPEVECRRHPLELKVHVFGPVATAILVIDRRGPGDVTFGYYTPDWEAVADPINTYAPAGARIDTPPRDLAQILKLASAMGAEIATFMRVDFFAGRDGLVFNEFSSLPMAGHYTPYGDRLLGDVWERHIPNAI